MSVKLSYRLLVGALVAAGAMASAHADVVEVEGAHVKFVYDTDFWGTGAAVVNGDAITFTIDPSFSLTRSSSGISAHIDNSLQALTVVAKSGYEVNYGVATTYTGTYSVATGGSGLNTASLSARGLLSGGSYDNGSFSAEAAPRGYGGGISFTSGTSGVIGQGDTLLSNGSSFEALRASAFLAAGVTQLGGGTSSVSFSTLGYQFTTTQVAAVPEADTYAMMLGGLGLLGAVVRRRRGAPK